MVSKDFVLKHSDANDKTVILPRTLNATLGCTKYFADGHPIEEPLSSIPCSYSFCSIISLSSSNVSLFDRWSCRRLFRNLLQKANDLFDWIV